MRLGRLGRDAVSSALLLAAVAAQAAPTAPVKKWRRLMVMVFSMQARKLQLLTISPERQRRAARRWRSGLVIHSVSAVWTGPLLPSPQVDGFTHLPRLIRPLDALAGARRFVGRTHDLQHFPAVFPGFDRRLLALHATGKVGDFLRETVVPDLLEHREGVALRRSGFLDGVSVTGLAVSQQRAAAQQVGARETAGAVDFAAVVHAAGLGPAIL